MPQWDPPSWLDAALVQKALRRLADEDASVKSVTLRSVGAAGDNYGSAMFRITAETTAGTKTVIVKTLPPGENLGKAMKECGFFLVEALMLYELVPQMQRLLDDSAPGRFPPFAARCPHHGDQPDDFIFLEDLAPQGFRLADRHRGLGLRHSLLALRTLARFHAASVALLARDPTLPDKLRNPFRQEKNPAMKTFTDVGWQCLSDVCRKWSNFPPAFADAVAAAKEKAFEKYVLINDYRPDRFNVIAHGDFWINNMMFRYEGQELQDIRLVDFQISHVTTPAVDVLYFLNTSVSEDVYANHLNLLIREYHSALREAMELLGLKAPSLKDLEEDIDENGFYSTFGSFLVLPIVKTQQIPDMEKNLEEESSENKFMYTGPIVERWFRKLIPEYISKDWL